MVLSLLENIEAKQSDAISWDRYIENLLSRCTAKQESDAEEGPGLRFKDPFGHMVWLWTTRIFPIEDISPLKNVFESYRYGTLEDVKEKLILLNQSTTPKHGVEGLKKSLALLACQERRADVLKLCLEQGGFPLEDSMFYAADAVNEVEDPETYQVLWECTGLQEMRKAAEKNSRSTDPAAVFDLGGRLPVAW